MCTCAGVLEGGPSEDRRIRRVATHPVLKVRVRVRVRVGWVTTHSFLKADVYCGGRCGPDGKIASVVLPPLKSITMMVEASS